MLVVITKQPFATLTGLFFLICFSLKDLIETLTAPEVCVKTHYGPEVPSFQLQLPGGLHAGDIPGQDLTIQTACVDCPAVRKKD